MKRMKPIFILFVTLALIVTLFACNKTTHEITFNLNGGSGDFSTTLTVPTNSRIDEPTEPTYEGFTFKGWVLDGKPFDFKTKIKGSLTLIAHWEPVTPLISDLKLNSLNQPDITKEIITTEVDEITFQYSRVKPFNNNHVSLSHTGLLANTKVMPKIKGLTVTFNTLTDDAELYFYYGNYVLPIINETRLYSGMYITLDSPSNYVVIQALDKRFTPDDFYDKEHEERDLRYQLKEEPVTSIEVISVEFFYDDNNTEEQALEVPKIFIEVNNKPIKNKVDYVDSKITIIDPENPENNLGGEEGLDAGIRLRGNSTRTLPKRPYKLKFDKKQSLFGLPKAKDWALLADYMDGSALHNYSALKMGDYLESFGFIAHPVFVELYLDNIYQGLYLLTEHQEVKEGRVEIDQDITIDTEYEDLNFMIEFDRSAMFYPDEEIEGTDYFILQKGSGKYVDHYYSIKYPKKKDIEKALGKGPEADAYFEGFFNYVKDYTENLYGIFKSSNKEQFKNKIDVDTLLDFMMIDFIMLETDHKYQSLKMHYIAEDDKLYFGPIWDYDSMVMGLPFEKIGVNYPFDKANDPKYVLPFKRKSIYNHFFVDFYDYHDGKKLLEERYKEKGSDAISYILEHTFDDVLPHINDNIVKDANIWYKGDLSMIFENLKYTTTYLNSRKEFLDDYDFKK